MTEKELQEQIKQGKANIIEPTLPEVPKPLEFDEYEPIIDILRRPRIHLTSAPTFIPKNFLEQTQYYDDGTDRRVYYYFNGSWSYHALT